MEIVVAEANAANTTAGSQKSQPSTAVSSEAGKFNAKFNLNSNTRTKAKWIE